MSKKKTKTKTAKTAKTAKKAKPEKPEKPKAANRVKVKDFSFPTKIKCIHCGSLNNRATSTQGRWQYRKCNEENCRLRFTVKGKPV